MNIIAMRQQKRSNQITQIKASIEKSKTGDFKQIVLATMSALGISRRTAREYVEVAFFELGIDIHG